MTIGSKLTRRSALATLGAGAATAAVGPDMAGTFSPALANTTPASKQAPGFYRQKVGDMEVTMITDGARTMTMPENFVRNIPRDEAGKALEAAYMSASSITVPYNPVIVKTGGKIVLIDTGNGQGDQKGEVGHLLPNMAAAGIDPKQIDMVVLTHFHGDHINGLRLADGSLAFPNAEVKAPAAEYAFWMSDENLAKAPDAMKGAFNNVRRVFKDLGDRVARYEMDKEVASGITPFATHGHTPGHSSLALQSGNARLLIQGDVTNIPALFLRNPGWHVMFDMDAARAEETRRRFYDRAVADKVLVGGFHFPFPALGYVEKDGANNFRLVPTMWNSTL
jgi:glyoxylase-like metal-dependent hydrolase (beta-lactamase superfamily II)